MTSSIHRMVSHATHQYHLQHSCSILFFLFFFTSHSVAVVVVVQISFQYDRVARYFACILRHCRKSERENRLCCSTSVSVGGGAQVRHLKEEKEVKKKQTKKKHKINETLHRRRIEPVVEQSREVFVLYYIFYKYSKFCVIFVYTTSSYTAVQQTYKIIFIKCRCRSNDLRESVHIYFVLDCSAVA